MVSDAKKKRSQEDSGLSEYNRSNKQLANNVDESERLEMYDDVLICSISDRPMQICGETAWRKEKKSQRNEQSKGEPNRGRGGKKKNIIVKEIIDLRSLLMQCAQAVENFDNKTLNDLMLEIRQHSSPKGDSMERVAHYFANAIDAHLTGTGTELYASLNSKRISAIEILKAYKMFVIACPFQHMSNIMANRTIGNLASRATALHVIDFGILYGCQWPCLIHALSRRPGGPPKFRITGIDFPQPGFRPAERVEDTCRRLAKYCERFGVPFEYNTIAQKWDTITLEDLGIEKNELLVVNSMYRLHNVQDATETGNSPRDDILNLIKRINPDMFIHGVANGNYNSPFFFARFKEALFHFSTMFDMFEATIPRDDEDRLRFEQQFFGKEAMNIIACDGTERIERPETYKHWQVRTVRAGFRQVSLDQETLKRVSKVKTDYNKNFSVDEDGKWILLGWKGRVIQGFSCWRPIHN
ncbi:scarecrow-like protein 14 [Phtheirospermum japonicum]|uniref:Scarecrow-like protein 14 n=2 Tax=Phtheirospermum japonicum TaxID=374723 RepID=A0A830DG79_9LAMI|nr:scarecrow-like protein 14 [Phtheirospermum japonicum]